MSWLSLYSNAVPLLIVAQLYKALALAWIENTGRRALQALHTAALQRAAFSRSRQCPHTTRSPRDKATH